jgi:hypothetical protein
MEGALLVASFVLLIVAGVLYWKKEDTDFNQASQSLEIVKSNQLAFEQSQRKRMEDAVKDQQDFAQNTVSMMAKLSSDMRALQEKKDITVHVDIKEPLKVSMVYRKREPIEFTPDKKQPGPLLKKAGIKASPLLDQ